MDVNLDDPATWPETLGDIEAVAASALAPDPRKGFVETEEPAEQPTAEAAQAEAEGGATGGETAGQPTGDEPGWVLLADGKHAMPYSHFKQQREEAEAAKAEAERLRAEIEALRHGGQAAHTLDGGQAQAGLTALEGRLAAAKAKLESVREDDPDLAESMELGIAALEDQLLLRREREAEQAQRWQAQQAQESAGIQAAIDANPVLSAWVHDPVWLERARTMERAMASDPQSAYARAADWDQRFAAVVQATEAVYGASPARAAIHPAVVQSSARVPVKPLAAPVSMSAMLGGEDVLAGDELQALSRMSPQQMMAHLGELAEKGALAGLVARVS